MVSHADLLLVDELRRRTVGNVCQPAAPWVQVRRSRAFGLWPLNG